jgi:TonB family protein
MTLQRRTCLVPVMIWLALGAVSRADDSAQNSREEPDEPVYDPGPNVTRPRLIHQVQPERKDSPGFRLSGKVVVSMVVSSAGAPTKVKILEGIDADVDQSVIEAVKQWRFLPGQKDGKAVAVRMTAEVHFNDR